MTTLTINLKELGLGYDYAEGFVFDEAKFASPEAMEKTLQSMFAHGLRRKINDAVNSKCAATKVKTLEAKKEYFAELVERMYAGSIDSRNSKIEITDAIINEKLALNKMKRGQEIKAGDAVIFAEVAIEQALLASGKYRKAKEAVIDLDIQL